MAYLAYIQLEMEAVEEEEVLTPFSLVGLSSAIIDQSRNHQLT